MESLNKRILGLVDKYTKKFMARKVLKTAEEVEANTNEENLASAVVVSELNNNLGGCRFFEDESGNKYVVGADSVPKKLGRNIHVEGDITQQLAIPSSNATHYTVITDNANVTYLIAASTNGGYIKHNSTTIDSVYAELNKSQTKSGSFTANSGDEIEFISQYGGTVCIIEHY